VSQFWVVKLGSLKLPFMLLYQYLGSLALHELARNLASVFGSTYKFHARIINVHLHGVIRTGTSEIEPNVNSLVGQRQAKVKTLVM
jgi:hypothetical protein